ncbi:MAG: CPBP family intramembrane metalloprotease [Clostridia bacterium]|nr:CPBP family intramembrane metalloprotease [Clostridia bacterium]
MNTNQLKLIDCLFLWGICFLLFAVAGGLLSGVIGIWAYYLCQIASLTATLIVARKTGFAAKKLLAVGDQSLSRTVGGALVWVGCILTAIPVFLFAHLLVPGFAVTTFHVYDYTDSHWAVAGIILLSGVAESILFDGFLYPRLRGLGKTRPWVPYLLIGVLGGLYHADLYVLIPMGILSAGIAYIRSKTGGIGLPMILRTLTVLITTAFMQVSDAGEELLGVSMGLVQVFGFGLVFAGAAIPAVICGAHFLGAFRGRSLFEKCLVVAIPIVLIAAGCGISAL